MKKLSIGLSAIALLFIVSDSTAQTVNNWKFKLGYNVSAPLGSFKNDYISNSSFRGGVGEISYAFNPKFSLGLASGYQDYYQKYGREVYHTQGNEYISAVISNSMQITPIMLKGTFSPTGQVNSFIKPYVSLGAGVNFVNYKQYLGEFPSGEASGNFAAQAGAGFMIPFKKADNSTGINIGATYNYAPYSKFGIDNLNTVGINAGVVINLK